MEILNEYMIFKTLYVTVFLSQNYQSRLANFLKLKTKVFTVQNAGIVSKTDNSHRVNLNFPIKLTCYCKC